MMAAKFRRYFRYKMKIKTKSFHFRLPGRMLLVRELKDRFDEGEQVALNTDEMDVHSVASLLKQYLRELPECLVPYKRYQEYMNIAMKFQENSKSENKLEQVEILRTSMAELPLNNYNVLKALCKFLQEVAAKTHINKMTALNLATVFGPNIIRHPNMEDNPELFMLTTADLSQQLAFMLINHSDQIFTIDFESDGKSVPVAVDDLLSMDTDIDTTMQPVPLGTPLEPKTFEELSEIRFDQRGDRRARSFQTNEFPTEGLSVHIPVSELSPTHSLSDESPVHSKPPPLHFTEDGKPVPPIRNKFRRSQSRKKEQEAVVNQSFEDKSDSTDNTATDLDSKLDKVSIGSDSEITQLQEKLKNMQEMYDALKCKYDALNQQKEMYDSLESKYDSLSRKKARCDERIRDLSAENSKIQSRYDEHIKNIEAKNKSYIQELCAKLDSESSSRAECVEKIVELKAKVHSYEMQYGSIGNSVANIYNVT